MYKLIFPAHELQTFNSLDAAAEFMCTVPYGFICCIDSNGDDHTVTLYKLIAKKLNNKKRIEQLKKDF